MVWPVLYILATVFITVVPMMGRGWGGILAQAFEKYAIWLLEVTALNSPDTSTAVMWLCGEVEKRPLCYESS